MKALSIKQPWAWLIVNGYKDIENRTWHTRHRGEFLIHASSNFDLIDVARICNRIRSEMGIKAPSLLDFKTGGIVGIADLVDCVTESYSPWFEGPYGFVIMNARSVPFQKCRGSLGFFDRGFFNEDP